MSGWIIALAAVVSGALAWTLTPQVSVFVPERSRWVAAKVHVIIAALLATGAGLSASGFIELAAFAIAGVGCAILIAIDLAVHRLPDRIVGATLLALIVTLLIAALVDDAWSMWFRALFAGAVLLAGYFVLAFISPAGLGLGDVKFASVVGVFLGWFGWQHVAVGTLLAFMLNAIVALSVLISRRGKRDSDIPFGPWMVVGAVAAVALLGR